MSYVSSQEEENLELESQDEWLAYWLECIETYNN
jgi:hypothetical protein